MNVVFAQPELGLGGAERLVLDAATELRARGHRVVLLTTRRDPAWIDEALDVRLHGRGLPVQIAGRLRALRAVARMAWLSVALRRLDVRSDVVVCALVAHVIPLLRRAARAPVVLYCHYPDRLLAPSVRGVMRWYRRPIARLEEKGTAGADRVLVNSEFTARRIREAFPRIAVSPCVVYPGVARSDCPDLFEEPPAGPLVVLTVVRFSPEKRHHLAVEALACPRRVRSRAARAGRRIRRAPP